MKVKFRTFNLKRHPTKGKYFTWFEFNISKYPDTYNGWWVELVVFNRMFNVNIHTKLINPDITKGGDAGYDWGTHTDCFYYKEL